MKTKLIVGILIAALVATSIGVAAARYGPENGPRYVDANNDGVCDNIGERPGFVDEDGDGIPNGQDDDYVPPRDGSGKQRGNRRGSNR